MSDTVTSVEKHGTHSVANQAEAGKLLVNGGGDRYQVECVHPVGSKNSSSTACASLWRICRRDGGSSGWLQSEISSGD